MYTTSELNLDNLKVGDKITTVNSKRLPRYGSIRVITQWDEKYKVWRYANPDNPTKCIGAFQANGHGYYFMSKSKTPDFYYSANLKHIKAAEKAQEKARINTEKLKIETERRMALALPIGDLLRTEYYDSEECYHLDSTTDITEILVKSLTDEQIITLKEWLNV